MTQAYPLQCSDFIPRSTWREPVKFKTALAPVLGTVRDGLRLFGSDGAKPVSEIVLSSIVSPGRERSADPGIAVWFRWDGEPRCIPVDRDQTRAANLQAIHHIIEVRRVARRHGTLALVRALMRGLRGSGDPDQGQGPKIFADRHGKERRYHGRCYHRATNERIDFEAASLGSAAFVAERIPSVLATGRMRLEAAGTLQPGLTPYG